MFDLLSDSTYWLGLVTGFLLALAMAIGYLCWLGMMDEADEARSRAEQCQRARDAVRYGDRTPEPANDATLDLRDAHVPPRPRTARSELRSRPR